MDKINCQLTEDEIKVLINHHSFITGDDLDTRIERMTYLNRRLKSKGKPEEPKAEQTAAGWGASA